MGVAIPGKFRLAGIFICSLVLLSACAHRVDETKAHITATNRQNSIPFEKKNMQSETEIRELIDGFVKAIRA